MASPVVDIDKKDAFSDSPQLPELSSVNELRPSRPPISYSSPSAFLRSFAARNKAVWTRRFALSLLAGQIVSLCITCTNVTTTELQNNRNWALPTTQSVFLYFSLFMVYTPYTMYKYGIKGWAEMVFRDGWKCKQSSLRILFYLKIF